MEINNNKGLEEALSGLAKPATKVEPTKEAEAPQMEPQEEIGFHKGSLNTLSAERNELVKMIANVEAIMQAHLKRLEELGVKIPVQKQE